MPESLIHRRFETQAALRPDAVAVESGNRCLTYAELNGRADALAHALAAAGVSPDTPVGVFAERSVETIAGLLGILKAGGAYFPLDPTHPRERLAMMLDDARPPVILTQHALAERLPATAARVMTLEAEDCLAASGAQPVLLASATRGRCVSIGIRPARGWGM